MTTYGEVVGAGHLTVGIDDVAGRNAVAVSRVDDDFLGQSGGLVGFSLVGDTLNHVLELQRTCIFGNDDGIEGVPTGNHVVLLHVCATLEIE